MKRLCSFLLVLFFCLILVGCHKHSFKAEVTNPTCTEQGYTTYTCECGKDTYVDNYVEALGHSYGEWKVVKESTETEKGLKERKCIRCNDKQSEELPILTHIHQYNETIIQPTCVDKGYTLYTCKCGDSYQDNEVEALGHAEEVLLKVEATCTTSGLTEGKKCSVCNTILVKQTEIKAKGHTESDWIIDSEATCIVNGSKHKECSVCKETLKIEVISSTGHNYIETITNPTCTTQGYTTYKCSRCSDAYKDNYVDALGHTEVILPKIDATCTTSGLTIGKKCSACEEVLIKQTEIKALGHSYSEWKVVKEATEEETGLKEKVCSRCNDKQTEIIPELSHTHKYTDSIINPTCVDKGYTLHTCKCGDSYKDNYKDALGHTEEILPKVEVTCTEDGLTEGKKCSVCEEVLVKQEETKALGHNYSEWKVVKEATEEEAGLKEKVCSRCNDKQTEIITELSHTHKYTDSIINPTCVDKGYTLHTCKCGDSYKNNYTNALGHNYGEVSYVWSNDYKTVSATMICQNDNNHIETETVNTIQTITQTKTCEINELSTFKAVFNNQAFLTQTKENIKTNEKINHINKVHHEKINATCTTNGTIEYWSCPDCDKFFSDEECLTEVTDLSIKELGHTEVILPKVDATCVDAGLTEGRKCSVCNTILVEQTEIKAKGHTKTDWIIDSEATCTENGSKHKECSICKEVIITEIIPSTGHSYKETITNPTCTTKGHTTYQCSRCSDTYKNNYTKELGHTEVILPKVDATCTNTGLTEGKKCSVCEEVLVKQTEIEALGHSYSEWKVVKEATEEEAGLKEKECSRCNDKQTEIIPELSHTHKYTDSIINPTCVDKGYTLHTCKCGDSYKDNYTNALGHTEVILSKVEATCTNAGLTEGKKCSVCEEVLVKQTEIKAKGHNYGEVSYVWSNDNKTVAATMICQNDNNHIETEMVNTTQTITQVKTCLLDELSTFKAEFKNSAFIPQVKDNIKTNDKINHINKIHHEKINATCTTNGTIEYWCCPDCNKFFSDEACLIEVANTIINKLDHIETDWIIDSEATCIKNGSKHKECSECKETLKTETVNSTGHKYDENIINSTCATQGYTLYTCSKCNYSYKDNYTNVLEHNFSNQGNIILLNDNTKAVKRYNCLNCTNYKDEIYTGYYLKNNNAYYFNDLGNKEDINESFINYNENTYYIINNIIIKNYYIIDGTIYDFGNDGIKKDILLNEEIVEVNNNKYYVLNNIIQVNAYILYNQHMYYFDNNGCALINTTYNNHNYGSNGYIIGNDILIKINDILYDVNNDIVTLHNHKITHTEYKEKTCTVDGNKEYYYCTNCDKYYLDNAYTNEVSKEEVIIKASHNLTHYEEKQPTCTEEGYKAYDKCNDCTFSTFESLSIINCISSDWIIDIDATCTENGSKHKECTMCNKVLETEEIKAKGHNYIDGKCNECGSIKDVLEFRNGYVYFGEYPQTLKEESVTITSSTPDSDGYYLGSDGERYAKVVAKPYNSSYVFNNKTTSIVKGITYYFKVEPIKWKIESESNGTYKLISTIILDAQMYYSSYEDRTIDEELIYSNNYEYSDIRKWLNNDFLNKAFTEEEQTYIITTKVDNSLSSTNDSSNPYICNNTLDKVYLPSVEEMTNTDYGYNNNQYIYDTARCKQLTDYAKALGCYMNDSSSYYNNGFYWLRSPKYMLNNSACLVGDSGYINYSSSVNNSKACVAPALTINLNSKCEEHQESNWIIFNESTCTTKGLKYKECSACKEIYDVEIIPAKGHTESNWIIDNDATCTEKGNKHKECTICNKVVETEEIKANGHNYIDRKCSVCGSIKDVLEFVDGYIYFGEYPQSLKDESITITSSTPDSDGYYLGSDGERYAKVVAKPYNSSYVFNNKTTSIVKGITYYFKVEPIKWKIESESNGTYKLISTIILDAQMYYSSYEDRTIDGKTIYPNNYEYSDIRKWLNNDFLNKAFTEELQAFIETTEIDNSLSSTGDESNPYICNNTLDKIYLPSVEEMTNTSYGYSSSSTRQKQLTDYAKALGCYVYIDYSEGDYWLRSPNYYSSNSARSVGSDGSIDLSNVRSTFVGVAPALSITIK